MAEHEISPRASKTLSMCTLVFPKDISFIPTYNHIQMLIQMQAASQTQKYAKPRGGATVTKSKSMLLIRHHCL